jgi:putative ABC transport system permease protein
MMEILRNMGRRKLRTGLTISGIVIGILALTVMGSMSEYFNNLVGRAVTLLGTNIVVSPKSETLDAVLTPGDGRKIERVPGVRAVFPVANDTLEELSGVSFGIPDIVLALPPEHSQDIYPSVTLKKGRWLQRGDDYGVVVGSKLADKHKLDLGSTLKYHDHNFTVVGVMNETQTTPDSLAIMSIETVRRLLKAPDLTVGYYVVPEDADQSKAIAQGIRDVLDNVTVQTAQEAGDQARQALAIFEVILISGAVLAVFVGGLAVINTMIMSVNERRHEIGLKKAIGASNGEIVFEYLVEAAVIGLVGGLLGLLLGWGLAGLLNAVTAQALGGSSIFTVTPRLVLIAMAFAVGLGGMAGLYPAWNAARLDPVQALRVDS